MNEASPGLKEWSILRRRPPLTWAIASASSSSHRGLAQIEMGRFSLGAGQRDAYERLTILPKQVHTHQTLVLGRREYDAPKKRTPAFVHQGMNNLFVPAIGDDDDDELDMFRV